MAKADGSRAVERFVVVLGEGYDTGAKHGPSYVERIEFESCLEAVHRARSHEEHLGASANWVRGSAEVWLNDEVMLWTNALAETTVYWGPEAPGRYLWEDDTGEDVFTLVGPAS